MVSFTGGPRKIRYSLWVDLTLFRPSLVQSRNKLGLSKRKFVLFVGRIDAIKGSIS